MNASSNNIKFSYLYRDYSNYKLFGETIFSIVDNFSLEEFELRIKSSLIDGEFFDPKKWCIIPLRFEDIILEFDHEWHEFESVEMTKEIATDNRTSVEFLKIIENPSVFTKIWNLIKARLAEALAV
jgi:hypothetical protein